MTDDVLAPWIAAYRDENPGAALDAAAIRRRVFIGISARQRSRGRVLRFVLPVAATFFASIALAAIQGALPRYDEVREWLFTSTESGRRASGNGGALTATPSRRKASPPSIPSPRAPAEVAAPALSLDTLPLEEPVRPRRDRTAPARPALRPALPPEPEADVRPAEESAPAAPEPEPEVRPDLSADLRAYEEAHRLHFRGASPALALDAWDTYLESYPTGAFAPEARLNRAECLIRLGRHDEARRMLVPVAEGSSFAYARRRAQKLLDAIEE
jgi:TolA-binding protein